MENADGYTHVTNAANTADTITRAEDDATAVTRAEITDAASVVRGSRIHHITGERTGFGQSFALCRSHETSYIVVYFPF